MSTSARSLDYTHRYVPGPSPGADTTLLLLHGTGGDENDLIDLGHSLAPHAALIAPRGRVLERGMPRFFRRLAEGVFDQKDLAQRTDELVDFIRQATQAYRLDAARVVALGYSNGANIAASVLLKHPGALAGAVLFHPMVPFEPKGPPALHVTPVFISAGERDPLVPRALTERLAELLRIAGARVSVHWESGGHELAVGEVEAARHWLRETFPEATA